MNKPICNPEKVPSCYAASLIIANRKSDGKILKDMEALEDPSYGDLLRKHILQNEKGWKEEDLWAK